MKYERAPYGDTSYKLIHRKGFYIFDDFDVPQPKYPIPIRENFRRAMKRDNPVWVPNSMTDLNSGMMAQVAGMPECDWSRTDKYEYTDWFGAEWVFVPEVGGPMLKPGTQFMDDITEWEKKVKFPNLDDYDFKGLNAAWWATCDPERATQINIQQGCTERLISLLGGYTDGMLAMATEPEAVRDFLDAFVEWDMKVVDRLCENLPIDLITYHDDWGTEKDTFFGERMMEEMVFEPSKRLFDHIHSKGAFVQLHSCGNIGRFVPYMIDMGVDILQIQARCNDIPGFKKKYGDRIGFEMMVEPADTVEGAIEEVHKSVDTYGKGGGYLSTFVSNNPEACWAGTMELFCYSREKYEEEQAND